MIYIRKIFDRISVSFYSDWNSFVFWKPMNWRDFTFIHLTMETNDYSVIFEVEFGILGLNFGLNIWRCGSKQRKKENDDFFKKLKQ